MPTSETARALVAAPGWRWLPGMRFVCAVPGDAPGRIGALDEALILAPDGRGAALDIKSWEHPRTLGDATQSYREFLNLDCIPDLGDPVTVAALLPVARLAYREPTLHTQPHVDGLWGVACMRATVSTPLCYLWTDGQFHGCGAVRSGRRLMRRTEVDVLIAAILAAPGVDR